MIEVRSALLIFFQIIWLDWQKTLCIAYWFRSGVSEEGLEVPAGQQLEDDEAGMLVETDSNEMNDVGVVELAHDERLHQKVHLGLLDEQTTQLQIQREVHSTQYQSWKDFGHVCDTGDTHESQLSFVSCLTSLVGLKLRQRLDGYRSFNSIGDIELVTSFIDFAEGTLSQSSVIKHRYQVGGCTS